MAGDVRGILLVVSVRSLRVGEEGLVRRFREILYGILQSIQLLIDHIESLVCLIYLDGYLH